MAQDTTPSISPSKDYETFPASAPPPPDGPLARVSSTPTLVPCIQLDFTSVANQLTSVDGANVTPDTLIHSLSAKPTNTNPSADEDEDHHPHHEEDEEQGEAFDIEAQHVHRSPADNVPLHVQFAEKHQTAQFADDALVLKILPDPSTAPDSKLQPAPTVHDPASTAFAISIPIQPPHHDPTSHLADTEPTASCFPCLTPSTTLPIDEAALLLPDTPIRPGLDLSSSAISSSTPPTPPTATASATAGAFVQRHGARDVAAEQQLLYAVPNNANAANTAMFIPVVDSQQDLRQLLLVVPPEQHEQHLHANLHLRAPSLTGLEGAKDVVDSISSMLPPLVDVDSKLELIGTPENATVNMNVTKQVSWVGYFILAVALFAVASQGTAVKWLPSVGGMIAASWLMQSQTLLMMPFALFQYFTLSEQERRNWNDPSTKRLIVAASLAQVCWASGFFLAIDYTSLFHAWALNNVHALAIVLIALGRQHFMRSRQTRHVSGGELNGARIATVGVCLMQIPALASSNFTALTGDAIAIASSLGAIVFLDLCKTLRNRIPLFLMMAPIGALNAILFSVASALISGTDFSMTDTGALGWIRSDRIALGLYLGGVVGFLGTVCCIAALKFLPNVVVGSVQTMMPVVGTIVAVLVGVDKLPDFWTACGGGVLLYGVLMIADATRRSEVKVVLNDHISEVGADKKSTAGGVVR